MVICKHFICRQLKICLQKSETKRIRTACKIIFTLSLHRLLTFRFNFVKHLLRLRIVLRRHVVSKPRNARDSPFKYICSSTKKNNIMITMFIVKLTHLSHLSCPVKPDRYLVMIYKQKLQNNETHLTYILSIRYVCTTFNQLEL